MRKKTVRSRRSSAVFPSSAARCTARSRRSAQGSAKDVGSRTSSSLAERCRWRFPTRCAYCGSADERERHRGVSHHTEAVLALCAGHVTVAWPAGLEPPLWLKPRQEVDVEGWEEACAGLPLSHMGRGPAEEPWFFAAAFAAGR